MNYSRKNLLGEKLYGDETINKLVVPFQVKSMHISNLRVLSNIYILNHGQRRGSSINFSILDVTLKFSAHKCLSNTGCLEEKISGKIIVEINKFIKLLTFLTKQYSPRCYELKS